MHDRGEAVEFRYLPRCNLGVVLVDAATTLHQDDLALLRTLHEAGTPVQVLLSKADLLSPPDRRQTMDYIQAHLQQELGVALPVHAVSTVGVEATLLTQWFEHEIEPLLEGHRKLTEASLARKTAHVRESVIAVLQTMLTLRRAGVDARDSLSDTGAARRLLDEADAARCPGFCALVVIHLASGGCADNGKTSQGTTWQHHLRAGASLDHANDFGRQRGGQGRVDARSPAIAGDQQSRVKTSRDGRTQLSVRYRNGLPCGADSSENVKWNYRCLKTLAKRVPSLRKPKRSQAGSIATSSAWA